MMGWLQDLLFAFGRGGGATVHAVGTETGEIVTDATGMALPVVQDCLDTLAGPIASLPLQMFRRVGDDERETATDHPLSRVLGLRASERHTAFEFRQIMQHRLGWYRNGYAEIVPGPSGAVDQLLPLHPRYTCPEVIGGKLWYRTWSKERGNYLLSPEEVWHLKVGPYDDDGLRGKSVLETHADTIGAAIAVHNYGRRFFRNDGQSGGILEHPTKFATKDDRTSFMDSWRAARTGRNQHKDVLLEFGIKLNRAALDNQKSQFLETRKENALELTRIWGIAPHKVGILDRSTNNNIAHQGLEFLTETLLPWLELWEQKINTELVVDPEYYAEFNVAGLLRADLKSMYEAFKMGREGGWLSINDIRRMLNMNRIEGGDDYLQPLNYAPVGTQPERPMRAADRLPWRQRALAAKRERLEGVSDGR